MAHAHGPQAHARALPQQVPENGASANWFRLIPDGATIFVDSGSTACNIMEPENCKADPVTHSSPPERGRPAQRAQPHQPGGIYNSSVDAFVGFPANPSGTRRYRCGSARGLSIRHGLSNNTCFEAELKREVVKNCKTLLLLADGSKFDREALFSFCPLEKVSAVVTDRLPHPRYLEFFGKQGIQVLYPVEK